MHASTGILSLLDSRPLPVLINTAAGRFQPGQVEELRNLFGRAGVSAHVQLLEPARLVERVESLRQNDERVIAVAGGDGSISTVAAALADSPVALLPLPLGTRNHFARRFGLVSLEAVANVLHTGQLVSVSTGRVNGRSFVNNVSFGYYPEFVRQRERLRALLAEGPGSGVAFFVALGRRPLLDLEIATDGRLLHRRTAALWIGIGRDSLQLPRTGAARRQGDVLEAVLPRPHGRAALLLLSMRVWQQLRAREELDDPKVEVLRAATFTVTPARPEALAVDGEIQNWQGPLRFEYRKDALRVLSLAAPQRSG